MGDVARLGVLLAMRYLSSFGGGGGGEGDRMAALPAALDEGAGGGVEERSIRSVCAATGSCMAGAGASVTVAGGVFTPF
jgi:hypothetical protein